MLPTEELTMRNCTCGADHAPLTEPAKREERVSFGISWFATEAEASAYAEHVQASGTTYNGGFMHGAACGRDETWDRDGLFAVTH